MTVIENIVVEINRWFTKPNHFPKDFIEASTNKNGDFCLRIGGRDIQLDSKGKFIECGLDPELLKRYIIK